MKGSPNNWAQHVQSIGMEPLVSHGNQRGLISYTRVVFGIYFEPTHGPPHCPSAFGKENKNSFRVVSATPCA